MNKWLGIGRLVADPEIRQATSGSTIASYRIAVDRQFKAEGQPEADFLPCVVFGKGAEFAQNYLRKGTKIAVEGRIQTRSYDDKDGKKVYVTEIIVEHQEFCESKKASAGASVDVNPGNTYSAANVPTTHDDDDWPF